MPCPYMGETLSAVWIHAPEGEFNLPEFLRVGERSELYLLGVQKLHESHRRCGLIQGIGVASWDDYITPLRTNIFAAVPEPDTYTGSECPFNLTGDWSLPTAHWISRNVAE